jgi:hypothetical protein
MVGLGSDVESRPVAAHGAVSGENSEATAWPKARMPNAAIAAAKMRRPGAIDLIMHLVLLRQALLDLGRSAYRPPGV